MVIAFALLVILFWLQQAGSGSPRLEGRGEALAGALPCPTMQWDEHRAAAVSVVEEILWTEEKFHNGTPGSAAQFRARESADALRERLAVLIRPGC